MSNDEAGPLDVVRRRLGRITKLSGSSVASILVAGVAVGACAMFVLNIRGHGPYPSHPDESYIAESAWNMVLTGDPNPHFFNYGSLPIYLSAAAQKIAAFTLQVRGEIGGPSEVSSIAFPYYSHPSVSLAPRMLCVLYSMLVLCAAGWLGFRLSARPESALLPPLVLAQSPLFQEQAWSYINVDILATALSSCALVFLLATATSSAHRARVVVPAMFCGAVIATKYNAGLLGVPFVLAIVWAAPGKRTRQLVSLGLASLAFFLLFEPYAILDYPRFLDDVVSEMNHYKNGHAGLESEPGLPQLLFYLREFLYQFGGVPAGLALSGILYGVFVARRQSALLLCFPLCSVLFMSLQRVNFVRNVLPAFALLTPFMALGFSALEDVTQKLWYRLSRRGQETRDASWGARMLVSFALVALACLAPAMRPGGAFEIDPGDSRVALTEWLAAETSQRCFLVVPAELGLRPDEVAKHCELHSFSAHELGEPSQLAQTVAPWRNRANALVVVPRFSVRASDDSQIADKWNELPDLLGLSRPVFRAGSTKLRWTRGRNFGNPRLAVYRLSSI